MSREDLRLLSAVNYLANARNSDVSLQDWIPAISPGYFSPAHLKELTDILERPRQRHRVLVSIPPRHAKSETVLHSIPYNLLRDPTIRHGYYTYGAELSERQSRIARDIARNAGLQLSGEVNSAARWQVAGHKGGVHAAGILGGATGFGHDRLLLDDLTKNRVEADSRLVQNRIASEFSGSLRSRLEPGADIVIIATRWSIDDIIGRLIKEQGDRWTVINLPVINPAGEWLWPQRFEVEDYESMRAETATSDWESLYMGKPTARGAKLFGPPELVTSEPSGQYFIGVDFAYSERSSADYSVATVLCKSGDELAVVDGLRLQVDAMQFGDRLRELQKKYTATVHAYIGGTERGTVSALQRLGIFVNAQPAIGDKYTRALPLSTAWNAGRVKLCYEMDKHGAPIPGSHANAFQSALYDELASFTGTRADRHDDCVDSLVAAYDAAVQSGAVIKSSKPRLVFERGGRGRLT